MRIMIIFCEKRTFPCIKKAPIAGFLKKKLIKNCIFKFFLYTTVHIEQKKNAEEILVMKKIHHSCHLQASMIRRLKKY